MRPIAAEKGIVKLIHPGRHVEILREPVTVAEVMSKNPRHCITRPDVFKFPWVVMKPDSVLPTGKVFFLVPNRTVYDLMKSEEQRNRPPIVRRKILAVDSKPKPTTTTTSSPSPSKQYAGMTPKNHSDPINDTSFRSTTTTGVSSNGTSREPEEDGGDEGLFPTPWLDERNSYREFRRHLMAEETTDSARAVVVKAVGGGDRASSSSAGQWAEAGCLKSCMRKPGSVRRSLGLRVSFVLPVGRRDDDQRRSTRGNVRRTRFPDFIDW
ncbi:hypothetical protein PanWU01x14_078260 [Parasponia andersonii]|uniref:Uncharacterized protein n=1 Tax=Parasponia andersonii TaxID=3476 RepID=A0A2P5DC19_PARAD|nr:hypothetical protein PanWU01x14_078260 [Parasponia andersonii]